MRLLLLLLPLLPFMAKADMDKICDIDLNFNDNYMPIMQLIRTSNCERNNVLLLTDRDNNKLKPKTVQRQIATWCRFDRAITVTSAGFTCILYDKFPRNSLISIPD